MLPPLSSPHQTLVIIDKDAVLKRDSAAVAEFARIFPWSDKNWYFIIHCAGSFHLPPAARPSNFAVISQQGRTVEMGGRTINVIDTPDFTPLQPHTAGVKPHLFYDPTQRILFDTYADKELALISQTDFYDILFDPAFALPLAPTLAQISEIFRLSTPKIATIGCAEAINAWARQSDPKALAFDTIAEARLFVAEVTQPPVATRPQGAAKGRPKAKRR